MLQAPSYSILHMFQASPAHILAPKLMVAGRPLAMLQLAMTLDYVTRWSLLFGLRNLFVLSQGTLFWGCFKRKSTQSPFLGATQLCHTAFALIHGAARLTQSIQKVQARSQTPVKRSTQKHWRIEGE